MTTQQRKRHRKQRIFRKALVIPAEHGAWSWLLVPYFAGVLVAGRVNWAVLLVLVGGLSGFLMRQPATAWMRIRRGRGRRADAPLALGWTLGFGLLAFLSFIGLLALGRTALLWLLLPLALIFAVYLGVAQINRARVRSLWMEVAGAAGLAAMAPAGVVAALNQLNGMAWALWGLFAVQNVLGVLYVRLRLADTHGREMNRIGIVAGHGLGLAAVVAAAVANAVPWLTTLPAAGFLLRAGWAAAAPRPVEDVKRFGFTEVGVEILGGLVVVLAYVL